MQLLPTFAALVALVTTATQVSAYPFMALKGMVDDQELAKRFEAAVDTDFLETAGLERLDKRVGVPPLLPFPDNLGIPRVYSFDAASQYVDLTGEHEWRAPGPDDQRGPCAGLNALANHGFISRDGIVDRNDIINGINKAVGLSREAGLILSTTTSLFDGDPITGRWSIGGYSPKVAPGGALQEAVLGRISGICGLGHLKSEGDASITRGDFTQPTGENNNCRSYPKFFKELLDLARERYPEDGRITPSILAEHQHRRKLHSISNNPNYFSPAFAGVAFTPAAHHFVFVLMANKTEEFPEGYLSPENLMSWFSYTGDPQGDVSQLKYKYGYERIPAPFYKRAPTQEWTFADILTGVAQQILAYPSTSAIGGNTGKVNSFAGVNVGDLTGGAFNAADLTDPRKLGCFLSQNIQAEAPSFISNVLQGPVQQAALELLTGTLVPALTAGVGACNDVLSKGPYKPMAEFADQFPGITAGRNDIPRSYAPQPGS